MKSLFTLLLFFPIAIFSAEIDNISFETDRWTTDAGITWDGPNDIITVIGDNNEYRRALITVDIPQGTTDLYFSGEVYFDNIVSPGSIWLNPKFKIYPSGSNTPLKACNFDSPTEDTWYGTYCHVANLDPGITQVVLEIAIQNATGTFKVRYPKITDTEPVSTPYSFPFNVPANPTCVLNLEETEKEAFNNDLLSSNCHYSFINGVSWDTPEVINAISTSFPHTNYRFPGGTVGNFYDYTTDGYNPGVGTFEAPFRQNKYNSGFTFGYTGFKNQVINTNGTATLMLNVIHDDVNTATSRVQSRINDGLAIEWIELGNENYFPTQAYGNISNGFENPDVDTYIAHTSAVTSSIKGTDPNLKVAVNINHLTYEADGWSDKLSRETYYDATVLHNYISPRNAELNFNSGNVLLRSYASTKKNFTEYKQHFGNTPTIVTEWGLQQPPESFLSVIASADIFMALLDEGFSDGVIKQAGIHMLYHSDVNQHQTSIFMENGSIRYTPTGVFYSKLFEVFKGADVYTADAVSDMLETDLPSVTARAVDFGDSIKVFAVNKLPVASELQLSLDGSSNANDYRKEVFAIDVESGWPAAYTNTADAWQVSNGSGNPSLPAYSITVITMVKNGIVTSAREVNPTPILAYPNPADQILFLSNPARGKGFEVFDAQGKRLLQGTYSTNGIDLNNFAEGVYFLQINHQTIRFVK